MKQITVLAFVLLLAVTGTFAKDKERASKHSTVKSNLVSITYGQPSMKGREIFGALVPFGEVWRTGADEATEITLAKDCMFAGRQCKKGTYSMFTIPNKGEWTIILNSELKQWGSFDYDKIKGKNVLEVKVQVVALPKPVETFTIETNDNGIDMKWDKTSVPVSIKGL